MLSHFTARLPSTNSQPAAMATVSVSQQEHVTGYRIHPAVMDACLHSSAAAAPKPQPGTTQALRVPAGFAALRMSPLQPPAINTLAQLKEPAPDGSVLCGFGMQGGAQGHAMSLQGLIARPMPVPAVQNPTTAAAKASAVMQPEQILYEIEWQSVDAIPAQIGPMHAGSHAQSMPAMSFRQAQQLVLGTSSKRRGSRQQQLFQGIIRPASYSGTKMAEGHASGELEMAGADVAATFGALVHQTSDLGQSSSHGEMSPAGAVSRLLELIQKAGAGAGGKLSMTTMGALPALPAMPGATQKRPVSMRAGISGAAMWALLRVAAMEYPKTSFGGHDVSALLPQARPERLRISSTPAEVHLILAFVCLEWGSCTYL